MDSKEEKFKNIFCVVSVTVSILLSVILLFGNDPGTRALSALGSENRLLFFLWGIFTGAATYFNLSLLASRLKYKNRLFEIILAVGCSLILLTVTVLGMEPLYRAIHVGSAMSFGVTTVLCLVWLLTVKLVRQDKRTTVPYLAALVIVAIIFIATSIQVGWFTALTQVLLADVCLAVMFCSNFLENWSLQKSGNAIELEAEV